MLTSSQEERTILKFRTNNFSYRQPASPVVTHISCRILEIVVLLVSIVAHERLSSAQSAETEDWLPVVIILFLATSRQSNTSCLPSRVLHRVKIGALTNDTQYGPHVHNTLLCVLGHIIKCLVQWYIL